MKETIARMRASIPEQKKRVRDSVNGVKERVRASIPEQRERMRNSVNEVKKRASRKIVSSILGIIGLVGLITYQNLIIIELALLGAFCDLLYELYGTKKNWWTYDSSHSHYMIAGRVPIGVVFTYFCMGMVAVTYVLFRLSL